MKNPLKPITKKDVIKPVRKDINDFVQVTRGYINDLSELSSRSPSAFRLFAFLIERMTRQNAIVISQGTLAEILGYDKSTISRAVKLLKTENWVQVVKIGTSYGYLVNNRVVWRTHNEKRYGHFGADVIVSETEQTDTIESLEKQPLKDIPNIKKDEAPISDNANLPPPDQRNLFDPDFDTVPMVKTEKD